MTTGTYDVVVVGGGGAGLTAAISAALNGASVLLLEKQPELGGNTARSIGSIPGAGSRLQAAAGVTDSPEQFVSDVDAHTGGAFNEAGLGTLSARSADLVHWLIDDVGIPLSLTQDYRHVGHSVNRLHNPPRREGRVLVDHLADFARAHGVRILTGNGVARIEHSDEGTYAVLTATDTFTTDNVILATDGFGANRDMVARVAPQYAGLSYLGGEGNTGDGIRFGTGLGGQTASMTAVLGFATMGLPDGEPSAWSTMVSWTVVENGGVVVDPTGARFADESTGYSAFVDSILESGGGGPVYVVFDQRILDSVSKWEERFRLLAEREGSPIRKLDPAAPEFGLDAAVLGESLASYARAAAGQAPDPFGRTDFGWAPLEGQLYVARSEPAVLTTLGGLVVDDQARVLRADGQPIAGLYAAGGTAQSIVGTTGARGYISGAGLLAALGYGYLAGSSAAARVPASTKNHPLPIGAKR
ncbi:FAD-dependent oxidoreductase [Tessaracoccus sp. OS52]|uniref:FAD-dependent oxidoreductase n=1 Tax=Tessaracoccus sp. OS52 TaxID=2886691 RepID=UPI001D121D4A|nr:FAD-dependent oxidoreductase [Tessaracoccus sp. OS52]MCC2593955.1 FAD-dependent oxidoreductase [Tessaracoccus sp. OS52]